MANLMIALDLAGRERCLAWPGKWGVSGSGSGAWGGGGCLVIVTCNSPRA